MAAKSPSGSAKSGWNPFGVLRRAKSTESADEAQRNALLEDAERIETFAARLVLSAIVLEAATWVIPLSSLLFRLGNFVADAAVAIGIYGEMRFGHVVGHILKVRLAEANERAANAELETEKLRAQFSWRRLSANAIKQISDSLAKSKHSKPEVAYWHMSITYFASDPEASNFAHELGLSFQDNGWVVEYKSASYSGTVIFGLIISRLPHAPTNSFDAARDALSCAGIEFKEDEQPYPFMTNPERGNPLVASWAARMYVGPKPVTKVNEMTIRETKRH
jgi:hypothetical protein